MHRQRRRDDVVRERRQLAEVVEAEPAAVAQRDLEDPDRELRELPEAAPSLDAVVEARELAHERLEEPAAVVVEARRRATHEVVEAPVVALDERRADVAQDRSALVEHLQLARCRRAARLAQLLDRHLREPRAVEHRHAVARAHGGTRGASRRHRRRRVRRRRGPSAARVAKSVYAKLSDAVTRTKSIASSRESSNGNREEASAAPGSSS